jgi:hypothetical protein
MRPSQIFDVSTFGMNPGSPAGMATGMFVQSMLPSLLGPDYTAGQFTPQHNFYDHKMSTQAFANQRAAIGNAATADADTYFNVMRGASRMMGMEFNKE